MASDNETVADVADEIRERCNGLNVNCLGYVEEFAQDEGHDFADRIESAHEREIERFIADLDALEKAMERVCSEDEIAKIIAVKKEIQNVK